MALVSVIMPIYNASSTIDRALESILQQSLDLDVVCVDDGSTDDSVQIINRLQIEHSSIRLLQQVHSGPAAARNLGLKKAKSDYVVFVDADDYIAPKSYNVLYDRIVSENADMVCHGYAKVDSKGSLIKNVSTPEGVFNNGKQCLEYLDNHFFDLSACTAIYSSDFLRRKLLSFPLTSNYEDSHFFKNALLSSSKVVTIPDILYFYVQYEDSRSTVWNIENLVDCCDLYMANIDAIDVSGEDLKKREARAFISLLAAESNAHCKHVFVDYFRQDIGLNSSLIIYGTGSSGTRLAAILLELGLPKLVFCDSNIVCAQLFDERHYVIPPSDLLKNTYTDHKLIIGSCFVNEIFDSLAGLGVESRIIMPTLNHFKQFLTSRKI